MTKFCNANSKFHYKENILQIQIEYATPHDLNKPIDNKLNGNIPFELRNLTKIQTKRFPT